MLDAYEKHAMAKQVVGLYEAIEDDVIRMIARRFRVAGAANVTDMEAWRIGRLQEMGRLRQETVRAIAKRSGRAAAEVERAIKTAGYAAADDDDVLYRANMDAEDMPPLPVRASDAIQTIIDQTVANAKHYMNLVNTSALESAQTAFTSVVNQVYLEVNTGVNDYISAIRKATRRLAERGITTITYKSAAGRITRTTSEVAVRRAVLTSMGQVSGRVQIQRARDWRVELVEVSSHMGARPDHAAWQGKVYSIDGGTAEYPNLAAATGYGTGAGLMGWNCRHSMYPFFEGVSEPAQAQYNRRDSATLYEESQEVRAMERGIRLTKRKITMADGIGDGMEAGALRARLSVQEADLRAYIEGKRHSLQLERLTMYGYAPDMGEYGSDTA
jgi:hypothetical protein